MNTKMQEAIYASIGQSLQVRNPSTSIPSQESKRTSLLRQENRPDDKHGQKSIVVSTHASESDNIINIPRELNSTGMMNLSDDNTDKTLSRGEKVYSKLGVTPFRTLEDSVKDQETANIRLFAVGRSSK